MEESSKKAMSLNQLHNRFITASKTKSTPYSLLSEMKNNGERLVENDAPSFNLSDFDDSPSPPKTVTELNEEKVSAKGGVDDSGFGSSNTEMKNHKQQVDDDVPSFSVGDFDSPSPAPKTVMNDDKFSSEQGDDGEEDVYHDESDHIGYKSSSSEKVHSKVTYEDELSADEKCESADSFGEPSSFVVDDLDSQHEEEKQQKVKIQGRRRLCKVVVKDDEEEDDKFHDVEMDFSAAKIHEFDSPSPVKNPENTQGGGDEIRDILSNLSSRFEDLSIQKQKRPSKNLSTSSDTVVQAKSNVHKPVKVSVPTASVVGPHKYETDEVEDDDDDECMVTSGQKFVQKVESRPGKVQSDDFNKVFTLDDDTDVSASGAEVPFSLSNPKFNFALPSKIATMLYPHQREGLKWLWSLHCKGKGGILGDDMGLGKTMQICGFLAGLFHSNLTKRVLVVAPKTLLPHWIKELGVVGLAGKTREYFGTCVKARQYELQYILQDKGVLLTTYDIVRNNVKALSGDYDEEEDDAVTWDYMILDEGHLIKNPSTQRAKSLLAIPCAHRIIISGTPIQNNLKELWALFNFACPELLGDKKCFKDKYEALILRGNDKNASDRDKRIGSAVAQDLRKCIQPYFLRRLKNEVFRDDGGSNTAKLSKKNEIIVWLKLSSCQRQLYEAFLKSEIVLSAFDGSPLAALTILKKICDHPLLLTKRAAEDVLEGMESVLNPEDHSVAEKLATHIADTADRYIDENNDVLSCKISFIASLLDKLIPEGHNVLIFSQTRKMLNHIQDTLNARGYKFLRIDGTTKASDRLKIVNDFQEGVGAPIFLLTSQVGGLGLTLTKADRVIVVDPAWNPSTDNQSVDRAYRIGQKKDVLVYRLMTCGTVEEKIYRKQIYKGGLFRSATEHREQIRYFSQQDLRELFSIPKQGFDVSLTQQQLHEEHDSEHKMDSSLKDHTKFLESLGIAGISNHSLLFSKTAPVPVVDEEELTRVRQSTYVGNSYSRTQQEQYVDAAQFAFNPKDVPVRRNNASPSISSKLTESEIKQQINRLSQVYENKAMVGRLADKGEKIRKQITELNSELRRLQTSKTGEVVTIDLDDIADDFNRVVNV
ncbi:SNF2-related, N-terminal domain-containing protein [Artemisia annua]|uniref:SNF2-related, N-terminal domain-containing protein n=1 Tax=Artemisia annua TaxID=35608 RepID=A0A2U1MIK3_ARTAN|nr:SNF2-related, N-terminal domain-containing protein [Artemisia annua]